MLKQVGFFTGDLRNCEENEIIKYKDCEYIYSYSLIYNVIKNDYYIISDVKCDGIKYSFQPLTKEEEKEEIIEEKEELEKEEEKEEITEEKEERNN